jgi:hypothetical protein
MPARQKAKVVPATGRKTKVKQRGRRVAIIDQFDASGNPVPMALGQHPIFAKPNNVGPFTRETK